MSSCKISGFIFDPFTFCLKNGIFLYNICRKIFFAKYLRFYTSTKNFIKIRPKMSKRQPIKKKNFFYLLPLLTYCAMFNARIVASLYQISSPFFPFSHTLAMFAKYSGKWGTNENSKIGQAAADTCSSAQSIHPPPLHYCNKIHTNKYYMARPFKHVLSQSTNRRLNKINIKTESSGSHWF